MKLAILIAGLLVCFALSASAQMLLLGVGKSSGGAPPAASCTVNIAGGTVSVGTGGYAVSC